MTTRAHTNTKMIKNAAANTAASLCNVLLCSMDLISLCSILLCSMGPMIGSVMIVLSSLEKGKIRRLSQNGYHVCIY